MKNSKASSPEIIVVDVGNTSALFGHFRKNRLIASFRIASEDISYQSIRQISRRFKMECVSAIVIASVVPRVSKLLLRYIPQALGKKTYLVGKDLKIPIQNKYANPSQVGIDRLMNAVAVHRVYQKDAIVIDFGTAITFDIVTATGQYLGGVIAPGIEITLEALYQKTALLPKIHLAHPRSIIGRNTIESIRVGCSYGIGGLCDRLVREISRFCHFKPLIIATGGYAPFMKRYCRQIDKIDSTLTLRGIYLTYLASKIKKA